MLRAWLPAAAYIALIFWLSSIPDLTPGGGRRHLDKVAHVVEYGLLAVLLLRGLWLTGLRRPGILAAATILAGASLGALDERWQGRFGRQTSLTDWIADACAAAVIAVAGSLWLKARSARAADKLRTQGGHQ